MLEQFAGDVGRCPDAARRHRDLARIGLRIGDEFGNGFCRNRRIDLHHERHVHEVCDRRDVAEEIETEILVERGVDRIRHGRKQQRVAVRGRAHDKLRGDTAAAARPVLDDELLTQPLRTAIGPSGVRRCRWCRPPQSRRSSAPGATDRLALLRSAKRRAAQRRRPPDARHSAGKFHREPTHQCGSRAGTPIIAARLRASCSGCACSAPARRRWRGSPDRAACRRFR